MELLGGDAHLAAQAEFSAVGEPGGGVYIHGGAVHALRKELGLFRIFRDNGLAVTGGVGSNVGNGLINAADDLDGQNVVQKLCIEVLLSSGSAGDDGCRLGTQPQLHWVGRVFRQTAAELGQKFLGNGFIYQQHLLGVADAGAAGFGVFHDVQGHILVGGFLDVYMANAGAGGNAGHGGGA